jgi:hypothetical protein
LPAKGRKGLADDFLIVKRTVDFSGVEKGHAAFDGCTDQRDHVSLVGGIAVTDASESERGNFESASSKRARLHDDVQ